MSTKARPEPRAPVVSDEKGRIPKGVSGNPGGQSKEKRAFLDRLKSDDADEIYEAFMAGVRGREWSVVLRAVEYLAGKPPAAKEDGEALAKAIAAWPLSREEMLAIAKGETP